MKNQPEETSKNSVVDDSFDKFLSAQLQNAHPYIADDGFALQVMAKLPAQRKLSRWQEWLIILVPLAIICMLVLSQPVVVAVISKIFSSFFANSLIGWIKLSAVIVLMTVVGIGISFAKELKAL